jgi:hypothetical protein
MTGDDKRAIDCAEPRHGAFDQALAMAVPLWIRQFKGLPLDQVMGNFEGTAELLALRGNILIDGGGNPGDIADLFNRLARAVAAMSFLPGGVTTFGMYLEADHPERAGRPC